MQKSMTIDSVDYTDPVLRVMCSGPYGVGSKGNPSAKVLRETIENWMDAHPELRVEQIEIDYTDVEYFWGDGPVSSVLPLIKRGVTRIRLIASSQNRAALQSLVDYSGFPSGLISFYENKD
jgi:hypothetical protein